MLWCLGRFVVDGKNSAEGDIGNILSIVLTFPGTVVVDDLDHGIFVICGNVDDGVIRQLQSYFSQSLGKGQASVKKGIECGKTTFLGALSEYIPKDERIITIEDNAELKLQGIANLVRLEARTATINGAPGVSIRDLIKSALRMRPDRIIVGEVRGGEVVYEVIVYAVQSLEPSLGLFILGVVFA